MLINQNVTKVEDDDQLKKEKVPVFDGCVESYK